MKVGIISMQRVINYGSFLQAYGLKRIIELLGNDVEFIDYHVEPPVVIEKKKKVEKKLLYLLKRIYKPSFWKLRRMSRRNNFTERYNYEFLKLLNITDEKKYNSKVDTLIIGSDEVFNCLQSNSFVGYSMELFGKSANAKKIISYAASFGTTTYDKLRQLNKTEEISSYLNKFSAISVRDLNSYNVVRKLTSIEPYMHLDPVLVYDFKKEVDTIHIELEHYIVVYAYGERLSSKEMKEIKKFAKNEKKKIISVGVPHEISDIFIVCNPFEVLAYISKADMVITDTFHGTVFSIKYNIPFATIVREDNYQKLTDLLQKFDCLDREYRVGNDLNTIFNKSLNIDRINYIIDNQRQKAIEYLKNNI